MHHEPMVRTIPPVIAPEIFALLAGVLAGCLAALVGVGGGIVLVPLLNVVMGLSFREATAVSLGGRARHVEFGADGADRRAA